jgi:hypothetical protein
MMGPVLETYRGNKIVMTLVALLALGPAWLVYVAFTSPSGTPFKTYTLIFFALPAFWFAWLMSLRVTLHPVGITYRSLFGEKEMRWDMVERFGYEAITRSINFIPIGTYYLFRLRDAEGNKVRIGNRIERPAKLGEKIIEMTTPGLLQNAIDRYNSGEELDFGVIKVNRTAGIKLKKLFGYNEIPWDQVASFAIQQGEFYIWRVGEKRTTGWGLHFVFNAFALLGLLQSIFKPGSDAAG